MFWQICLDCLTSLNVVEAKKKFNWAADADADADTDADVTFAQMSNRLTSTFSPDTSAPSFFRLHGRTAAIP